jgi:serpin B
MVLVVPATADGLEAVLADMKGDWRTGWNAAAGVRQRPVVLSLPKWTARKPLSLTSALKSLGMKRAFVAGEADLSGLDGTRDLFVSDVVHEGFVEVSEEGTDPGGAARGEGRPPLRLGRGGAGFGRRSVRRHGHGSAVAQMVPAKWLAAFS